MSETRRFLISGRVQGVGFRAATHDFSRGRSLAGWVRNLPDGEVEVVARGSADDLDALRSWLHHGPRMARVNKMREVDATGERELPVPFRAIE